MGRNRLPSVVPARSRLIAVLLGAAALALGAPDALAQQPANGSPTPASCFQDGLLAVPVAAGCEPYIGHFKAELDRQLGQLARTSGSAQESGSCAPTLLAPYCPGVHQIIARDCPAGIEVCLATPVLRDQLLTDVFELVTDTCPDGGSDCAPAVARTSALHDRLPDVVKATCRADCSPPGIQEATNVLLARACASAYGCDPEVLVESLQTRLASSSRGSADVNVEPILLQVDAVDTLVPQIRCPMATLAVGPNPITDIGGTSMPHVPDCRHLLDEAGMNEIPAVAEPNLAKVGTSYACKVKEWNDNFSWTSIRPRHKSYAIGTCRETWSISVEDNGDSEGYRGGYFGGNFQYCGGLHYKQMEGTGAASPNYCSRYLEKPDFARYFNCHPGEDCNRDGEFVTNHAECRRFANVKPWQSSASPTDELLPPVPANARSPDGKYQRLKWRYLAKSDYVLVHDTAVASGKGRWTFVPRSCLGSYAGAPLPASDSKKGYYYP